MNVAQLINQLAGLPPMMEVLIQDQSHTYLYPWELVIDTGFASPMALLYASEWLPPVGSGSEVPEARSEAPVEAQGASRIGVATPWDSGWSGTGRRTGHTYSQSPNPRNGCYKCSYPQSHPIHQETTEGMKGDTLTSPTVTVND